MLLNELFQPEARLALEISPLDVPPLAHYLGSRGEGSLLWARGIDQADRPTVHVACDRAFGDAPIDLVVDDASHWYAQTLASFTAIFPRMAPGGLYAIEDRASAHWPDPHWQGDFGGPHVSRQPPLSNLLVDLMLLAAGAPSAFERVAVDASTIYVTCGPGALPREFAPSSMMHNRGQPIPRFAPSAGAPTPIDESPRFLIGSARR